LSRVSLSVAGGAVAMVGLDDGAGVGEATRKKSCRSVFLK
jgi:hypothetical protein